MQALIVDAGALLRQELNGVQRVPELIADKLRRLNVEALLGHDVGQIAKVEGALGLLGVNQHLGANVRVLGKENEGLT